MDKRQIDTALWMGEIENLLSLGKDVPLSVTGNSMAPFLRHGRDRVLLRPFVAPAQKGDILLYKRPNGQYILHRVLRCQDSALWMVGDAQTLVEQNVPAFCVLAKVVRVQRKGKWITHRNPIWFFYKKIWPLTLPFRHQLRKLHIQLHKK